MNDYEKQALDFAKKHGVTLEILSSEYKPHFHGETQRRHVFKIKLSTDRGGYTFEFGQSINNGAKDPTMYDILATVEKHDPGDFEEFLRCFGFDPEEPSTKKIYKAVCSEFRNMERLFTDEQLEEMGEIQ